MPDKYYPLTERRLATAATLPNLKLSSFDSPVGSLVTVTDGIFGSQIMSFSASCGCDCPEYRKTVESIGRWASAATQTCGPMIEIFTTTSTKNAWGGGGAEPTEFTSAPSSVTKTVTHTKDGPGSGEQREWSNGTLEFTRSCEFGTTETTEWTDDPDGTDWEIYYSGGDPDGTYDHVTTDYQSEEEDPQAVAPGYVGDMDADGAAFSAFAQYNSVQNRQNSYVIDLSAVADEDWPDGFVLSGLLVIKTTTVTTVNDTGEASTRATYDTESFSLTKTAKTWQGERIELAPLADDGKTVRITQELINDSIQLPAIFSAAANA